MRIVNNFSNGSSLKQ